MNKRNQFTFITLLKIHIFKLSEEMNMLENIKQRVIREAEYIVKEESTIRKCASVFKVSKSTVHNDLSKRLEKIDRELYLKVRDIIETNKKLRHIRGGIATKEKYKELRHEKEES